MDTCFLKLLVLVLVMSTFILSDEVYADLMPVDLMPCSYPFIRYQRRLSSGECVCPSTYPYRVEKNCDMKEKLCCTTDSTPRECKCRFGYAYHIETDCCYKIKFPELTIHVNDVDICQNRNLTPKEGDGCCIMELDERTNKIEKKCHCKSPGHYYKHPIDKCGRQINL